MNIGREDQGKFFTFKHFIPNIGAYSMHNSMLIMCSVGLAGLWFVFSLLICPITTATSLGFALIFGACYFLSLPVFHSVKTETLS
jgi:hypothetical protein